MLNQRAKNYGKVVVMVQNRFARHLPYEFSCFPTVEMIPKLNVIVNIVTEIYVRKEILQVT